MTLSSQTSRAGASRQHMTTSARRRSKALPLAIIGAVLFAGALVFLLWPEGSGRGVAGENPGVSDPATAGAMGTDQADTSGGEDNSTSALQIKPKAEVPSLNLDTVASEREAPRFNAGSRKSKAESQEAKGEGQPASSSELQPSALSLPTSTVSAHTSAAAAKNLRQGMKLIGDGKLVEGRAVLSDLLFNDRYRVAASDARTIRDTLSSVNQKLVFSDQVVPGDPLAETYTVQSGDLLSNIAPRFGLVYQFIERINGINARNLRVGQHIKLIKGPFHVRVVKHAFRLDVYLRAPDGSPIYVCSYPVGLGSEDSTPVGNWVIKTGSKVTNPDYRNPRTNQYYKPDNPKNPVGEYWMAIKGTDKDTEGRTGYGIHGTIDPDSIGTMASLGCVRLHKDDIKSLFYMLDAGKTTVGIVP